MKVVILGEHQGNGNRYEMYLSAPAGGAAQMLRDPEGNWVPYADYAALKAETVRKLEAAIPPVEAYIGKLEAEVERLTKERDHYQWASTNDGIACNERARENQELENQIDELKAENERLRTNLDYVLDDWGAFKAGHSGGSRIDFVFKAWLAAKETRP
jgi:hypothetical protein